MGITLLIAGSVIGALALRIPVAFALGFSSFLVLLLAERIPLLVIPQRVIVGLDSFPLMAIPFFVFAGELMNRGGITRRIVAFCNVVVGRFRGGLAMTNVAASMVFGGVSGSMIADVSAIGTVMIPTMAREGYDREFSAGITAASAMCGPLIPPSIPMIIYGVSAGVSIGSLFIAGVVPGLLIALSLMALCYVIALRRDYPRVAPVGWGEGWRIFCDSIWALVMPLIIIGGILFGVFTPTEAAAVAAVYSLFVGMVIYREIGPRDLAPVLAKAGLLTAQVMIIATFSQLFAWVLLVNNIPQLTAGALLALSETPEVVLLVLNALMLVMGLLLDPISNIVILVPLLGTTVRLLGIDPVHFGVIMVFNLCLGLLTPPVGIALYVASGIAKIPFDRVTVGVLPFLAVLIALLLLLTYVPELSLFLPRMALN